MTTLLLVRHAAHDLVGKALAGRNSAVRLNEEGRRQADGLARKLQHLPVTAVLTSPQPRAQETACAIGAVFHSNVECEPALDEIDFGAWTGLSWQQLERDPEWETWVYRRSVARPPNGEALSEVQHRIVGCLTRLIRDYADGTLVIVSHGDVLKAALAHYLNCSLDGLERFEIAPASVSIIAAGADWAQVRMVNGGVYGDL